MALQKSWTSDNLGATFPNAYCKVVLVVVSGTDKTAFRVAIFADKQASVDGRSPVEVLFDKKEYNPDVASNVIKEVYDHIKTLPKFDSAVDV